MSKFLSAAAAVCLTAAGGAALASAPAASAAPSCSVTPAYGANLVANPGAEDNAGTVTGTGTGTRVSTVVPNCWTTGGSALGAKQTSGGTDNNRLTPAPYTWASGQVSAYPNAPISTPAGTDVGSNLFYGGDFPYSANSSDTLSQTIDISSLSALQGATYTLSGLLGGYYNQSDNTTFTATFDDASGNPLGSGVIGPVTASDRNNTTKLLARTVTAAVPAGATSVVLTGLFTMVGTGNNNAYADNLSFVVNQPAASGGTPTPSLPEVAVPAALVVVGGALAASYAVRRRRSA